MVGTALVTGFICQCQINNQINWKGAQFFNVKQQQQQKTFERK